MIQHINITDAQPIDWDAYDAARQAARAADEHTAYLARAAGEAALPRWYSMQPEAPDDQRGPTAYAWLTGRGE